MIMYERLRRIYVSLREEERACQVLAAVGVHALSRSFDMAVERKQGISNLELLYQEISRAEKVKELRREQKKLKKKLKKIEKKEKLCRKYGSVNDIVDSDRADEDGEEGVEEKEVDDEMVDEAVDLSGELDEELNKLVDIMDKNLLTEFKEDSSSSGKLHQATDNVPSKSPTQKKRKQRKQKKHKQPQQPLSSSKKKDTPQQQRVPTVDQSQTAIESSFGSCCDIDANTVVAKCDVCLTPQDHCPCENDVRDSGYGSELLTPDNSPINSATSTPEGSEVSCSDGFCNHENGQDLEDIDDVASNYLWRDSPLNQKHGARNWLSLQQMLENFDEYDGDEENCYIPQEVVLEYQCQREKVEQQRQKLRQTLRENFARLCKQHKSGKLRSINASNTNSLGPACI
uniref:Gametogenetin-binding protein 2-like n=2 Tax=Ceratitis capitata TaxID=7213 RepID=W8BQ06_CERCA